MNRDNDMAHTYPVNAADSPTRLWAGRILATSVERDAEALERRLATELPDLRYRRTPTWAGPGTTLWYVFERLHAAACTCATCSDARAMGL